MENSDQSTFSIAAATEKGNEVKEAFNAFCAVPCDDGMVFDPRHIDARNAGKDREYPGYKLLVPARLGSAPFKIEVDL